MKTKTLVLLALLALLSGCGKPAGSSATEAPASPTTAFPWPEGDLQSAGAKFGALEESATGLRWKQLSPGTGDARPAPGDLVSAHYRGSFLDGSVFDESYKRGEPIRFPVGQGRVIRGWDEALVQMARGEKRLLVIPYWLAYGETGRPPVIPERATLVFEVEMVGWESAAGR